MRYVEKCAQDVVLRKDKRMKRHAPLAREAAAAEGVIVCPASGTDYFQRHLA